MSGSVLGGASYLLDNIGDGQATTASVHMIWHRKSDQPAQDELVSNAVAVVHRKAERRGVALAQEPKRAEFRDVSIEPGLGIRFTDGSASDHFMLSMEFDVLSE